MEESEENDREEAMRAALTTSSRLSSESRTRQRRRKTRSDREPRPNRDALFFQMTSCPALAAVSRFCSCIAESEGQCLPIEGGGGGRVPRWVTLQTAQMRWNRNTNRSRATSQGRVRQAVGLGRNTVRPRLYFRRLATRRHVYWPN